MPSAIIASRGTAGVDVKVSPLAVGRGKLAYAYNLKFEEGTVSTRYGMEVIPLGVQGQFQGAEMYYPGRTVSAQSFSADSENLVLAAGGRMFVVQVNDGGFGCRATELAMSSPYEGPVWIFAAMNYLVTQAETGNTRWWAPSGGLSMIDSPGMQDCPDNLEEVSHDSFCDDKHRHFLVNGAGLGAFVHGRTHQEHRNTVYVSDMVHKRGFLSSGDVLLMEEQALASYGDPLVAPTKLGNMTAMAVVPATDTAYGDGELVAYFERGVVSFNTFQFPRESRSDADGKPLTEGWETKRMVTTRLNTISATGRYAVSVLPRDHLFRSRFGLHLLRTSLGTETMNDERENLLSLDVQPILEEDDRRLLSGAATGHWLEGHRFLATTGMTEDSAISATPYGTHAVVMNKATSHTEDRTPRPLWEGVWKFPTKIVGIHRFLDAGDAGHGAIVSDAGSNIYFAKNSAREDDIVDGKNEPIEWAFETGQFFFGPVGALKLIREGRFEAVFGNGGSAKVFIRSDRNPCWSLWNEIKPCKVPCDCEMVMVEEPLGQPKQDYREGTWWQFRVEGTGYFELNALEVEYADGAVKLSKKFCGIIKSCARRLLP